MTENMIPTPNLRGPKLELWDVRITSWPWSTKLISKRKSFENGFNPFVLFSVSMLLSFDALVQSPPIPDFLFQL